jgi:hypothetical protein
MDLARLPNGSLRLVSRRAFLVAGIPIAVSLLLLGLSALTGTLVCRRAQPGEIDCTVSRALAGFELSRSEVRGLTGASLGRSGGRSSAYRVDLQARSGAGSLTPIPTSGAGRQKAIVEEINRFVADERAPSLTVSEGKGLVLLVVGLVFLGAGLLATPLWTPIVTWTFDRRTGSLTVNSRRASGGTTATYPLDELRSATVTPGHVAVRLASGEHLLLASDGHEARAREAVKQIRAFLGLSSVPDPADAAEVAVARAPHALFGAPFGRSAAGVHGPGRAAVDLSPRAAATATDAGAMEGAASAPASAEPTRSAASRYRSFPDRLLGVALFRAPAYRQVADDPAATRSALAIVLLVTALVGFVSGMTSESMPVNGRPLLPGPIHGVARMLVELGAGLVSWRISGAVGALVARALFHGRTDSSEMLRVLGYASVFRLGWLIPHGYALSWLLSAVGTVIAMREAAEFDTPKAVITAAITWAVAFAVSGIVWLFLTVVAVSLAPALP